MRKTPSHTEKKILQHPFPLKNRTGSVLIGASLVLLAMYTKTLIQEKYTPTKHEPKQKNTHPCPTSYTYSRDGSGKRKCEISSPRNANASREKTEEKTAEPPEYPAPQRTRSLS